jgi:hypothetical protein
VVGSIIIVAVGAHSDSVDFCEIEATRATPMISQGSEFQRFLYAPICDDNEGVTLSVLSALARQDIDPWAEAARLSRLPEDTAVEQIVALLDALPHRLVASLDRMKVASRLSALLPRSIALNESSVRPAAAGRRSLAAFAFNWRFFYLYFCLMLLINWLMAEFHTSPSAVAGSDLRTGTTTTAPANSPSNEPGKDLNSDL